MGKILTVHEKIVASASHQFLRGIHTSVFTMMHESRLVREKHDCTIGHNSDEISTQSTVQAVRSFLTPNFKECLEEGMIYLARLHKRPAIWCVPPHVDNKLVRTPACTLPQFKHSAPGDVGPPRAFFPPPSYFSFSYKAK